MRSKTHSRSCFPHRNQRLTGAYPAKAGTAWPLLDARGLDRSCQSVDSIGRGLPPRPPRSALRLHCVDSMDQARSRWGISARRRPPGCASPPLRRLRVTPATTINLLDPDPAVTNTTGRPHAGGDLAGPRAHHRPDKPLTSPPAGPEPPSVSGRRPLHASTATEGQPPRSRRCAHRAPSLVSKIERSYPHP